MLRTASTQLLTSTRRSFSTIPVQQIASVLKLNVNDEATAIKMDSHMQKLTEKMKGHPGMSSATRYVCKSEWAYELSFIFDTPESFGAWKDSELRNAVHEDYLKALEDVGIKEEAVYGGARVHDKW